MKAAGNDDVSLSFVQQRCEAPSPAAESDGHGGGGWQRGQGQGWLLEPLKGKSGLHFHQPR